jgi:hypothetical protein
VVADGRANRGKAVKNKTLTGSMQTCQCVAGVRKVGKMHHFGHRSVEIAALEYNIVIYHYVIAKSPWNKGASTEALYMHCTGVRAYFLVATAQQG